MSPHLFQLIADKIIFHSFFFFNDTATTEIYTLSLHDALPISPGGETFKVECRLGASIASLTPNRTHGNRSEEHTSELQSQSNIVCRLLLEKKKNTLYVHTLYRIEFSQACSDILGLVATVADSF